MSEDGWKAFLAAEGLEDWVVLHGGAAAFFVTDSLSGSARLADAVAEIPGVAGSGAVLTVTDRGLSVRLTRDVWQLEQVHVARAREVSTVARELGAPADRASVQEVQLAIAAKASDASLPFWRAVLGYSPVSDDNGVDPLGHGSTVWLQELSADKALRHAMHIDVSVPRDQVEARVAAAIAAGGVIVAEDEAPEMWILADSAGNKVCVCAWPDGASAS